MSAEQTSEDKLDELCAKLADLPVGPEQLADLILATKAYAESEYERGVGVGYNV